MMRWLLSFLLCLALPWQSTQAAVRMLQLPPPATAPADWPACHPAPAHSAAPDTEAAATPPGACLHCLACLLAQASGLGTAAPSLLQPLQHAAPSAPPQRPLPCPDLAGPHKPPCD